MSSPALETGKGAMAAPLSSRAARRLAQAAARQQAVHAWLLLIPALVLFFMPSRPSAQPSRTAP